MELSGKFKWIGHEYAQAIHLGLQECPVVDSEEDPSDPDELLTAGPAAFHKEPKAALKAGAA